MSLFNRLIWLLLLNSLNFPIVSSRTNLLRSFQGHDPEPLWNLLNISRHLFSKGDCNAPHLLHLITEECLLSYQMMFYWMLSYNSSPGHQQGGHVGGGGGGGVGGRGRHGNIRM